MLAAILGALAFGLVVVPIAHATSPAHGIRGLRAVAAEATLAAAQARGVGELGASAFARSTPCGAATFRLGRATSAERTTLRELRRLKAKRPSSVRTRAIRVASVRLARQRAAVRAAARLRRAACTSSRRVRAEVEGDGVVAKTVTTERPTSVVSGRGMAIALPIDFRDAAARRAENAPARYEQMLFGSSYPHGGGSVAKYFSDMSFGAFTVDGDVAPWRRAPGTRASYAAKAGGMGAFPNNSQSLLEDAVALNDAAIDFGRYDNDGRDGRPNSGDDDGYVDAVFVVFAGTSAAEDGNLDRLWPHAWRHVVSTNDRSRNGGAIRVGRYAAVPERMPEDGSDGDLLTVGVAAHELGHILGLPDLVDGSESGSRGAGQWDLMGSGMYGFASSSRPTGLSAWSRTRLGWVTPQLVEGDDLGRSVGSAYDTRSTVRLPIDGTPLHESFLVERRTRTGFDADLPGEGLLVWHIDDSADAAGSGPHPRVELVAADGSGDGNAGDLLGPGGHMSDSSSPSLHSHAGTPSLVVVQNVRQEPFTVDLHAGTASRAPTIDAAIDDAGPKAAFPTALLDAPLNNARLRGTVAMQCTGTGNPNVNRVSFNRDGATLLSNVTVTPTAPSSTKTFNWNSASTTNGAHTLNCTARNTASQVSPASTVSVTVDNALPSTPTISAPAAGAWVRGTVPFSVAGTDAPYGVTSFSHRVDGIDNWQGPWAEVTPAANSYGWDTTLVANGAHVLTARSRDLAGNVSAISAARTVNVDNAVPTMPVPIDATIAPDLDFQTSTASLSGRWVAATDTGGSGLANYAWRFFTTPACMTVVANRSGAGLTVTATGLTLTNGSTYHVCVTASDVAGNLSTESCSDGIVVDSVAPTLTAPIDGAPAPDLSVQSSTTSLASSWAAGSDGAGSGIAAYDWRFCTSVACGTILASGSGAGTTATAGSLSLSVGSTYYACIRAVDGVGNASAWTCSNGVLVDIAPTMPTPSDGVSTDIDAQVSTSGLSATWAAATDNGTISGYAWRFCTSPACGTIVASGTAGGLSAAATGLSLTSGTTYFACVRATDDVGNQSPFVCSDGVMVDTTAPTSSHGGLAGVVGGIVNLLSSSADAGGLDRVEYRIDAVTRATAVAGGAVTFDDAGTAFDTSTLVDGNHAFRVATFDLAGNQVLSGPTTSFVVNNTVEANPPTGTVTSPAASSSLPLGNVVLSANVSDDNVIVSIEWLLDGSPIPGIAIDTPPAGYASGVRSRTWGSTSGVSPGAHTISARLTDASGNVTLTPGVSVTKP